MSYFSFIFIYTSDRIKITITDLYNLSRNLRTLESPQ